MALFIVVPKCDLTLVLLNAFFLIKIVFCINFSGRGTSIEVFLLRLSRLKYKKINIKACTNSFDGCSEGDAQREHKKPSHFQVGHMQ